MQGFPERETGNGEQPHDRNKMECFVAALLLMNRPVVILRRNDSHEIRCRLLACERKCVRKRSAYADTWYFEFTRCVHFNCIVPLAEA